MPPEPSPGPEISNALSIALLHALASWHTTLYEKRPRLQVKAVEYRYLPLDLALVEFAITLTRHASAAELDAVCEDFLALARSVNATHGLGFCLVHQPRTRSFRLYFASDRELLMGGLPIQDEDRVVARSD